MGIIQRLTKKKTGTTSSKETTVEAPAKKVSHADAIGKTGEAYRVLLGAHMSEKAAIGEAHGQYTFLVAGGANKFSVKQAVKQVYGVLPISVRIVNLEGKRLRAGRSMGKRSDMKKAIVTVPKGKVISIHEGV